MTFKTIPSGKKISDYFLPLICLIGFFIPSIAFGQTKTITGKVTGSDGAPVAGVTEVKGTNTGKATYTSDNFSIAVSKPIYP